MIDADLHKRRFVMLQLSIGKLHVYRIVLVSQVGELVSFHVPLRTVNKWRSNTFLFSRTLVMCSRRSTLHKQVTFMKNDYLMFCEKKGNYIYISLVHCMVDLAVT